MGFFIERPGETYEDDTYPGVQHGCINALIWMVLLLGALGLLVVAVAARTPFL